MKHYFKLVSPKIRQSAKFLIDAAPENYACEIKPYNRTLDQNAKFHAMCGDFAKSGLKWAGKERTASEWKVLLVSGHAVATKEAAEVVPGLEGEFINLRESTALMTVKRGASLIEYAMAFGVQNGVRFTETSYQEAA